MSRRWLFAASLILSSILMLPPGPATAASAHQAWPVCATSAPIHCYARALGSAKGLAVSSAPSGYGPSQLQAAYGAKIDGAAVVAIVGAYGDPGIAADLDVYSRTFHLPALTACPPGAVRAGCFRVTDQRGGQRLPAADAGWATETALDVEAVHAMCPRCGIALVEADNASLPSLMAAVDQAVASGAQVVSMSWGGPESAAELSADQHFAPAGVEFMASSGDSGYGVSYPAASSFVTAVGGTTLQLGAHGRAQETAWTGAGSGCSRYEPKPAWQTDRVCARRSVADLAADADPATGAAVYTSLSDQGAGWMVVGGTSLAAPLAAGLAAASKPVGRLAFMRNLYQSLGSTSLYDVSSGRNGRCASYLCAAGVGYDGPTGVGVPIGPGAL
jgi:subtilase family serine protease